MKRYPSFIKTFSDCVRELNAHLLNVASSQLPAIILFRVTISCPVTLSVKRGASDIDLMALVFSELVLNPPPSD